MDLAYIAVFAALIIVLGFLSIPIGTAGVPIVLQNASIILAALVLGPRRGGLTVLLFLVIGFALPVLAGGRTTIQALAGPTAGYLLGYLVSALVAGAIAYRSRSNKATLTIMLSVGAVLGLFMQYLFGMGGLMLRSGLPLAEAALAQTPFLLPDIAKLIVVILIALGVHSAFPDLMRTTRTTHA